MTTTATPCRCSAYKFPHRLGGGQCSDEDDDNTCHSCLGTGEGMWESASCGSCNGRGVLRPSTWRHCDDD